MRLVLESDSGDVIAELPDLSFEELNGAVVLGSPLADAISEMLDAGVAA